MNRQMTGTYTREGRFVTVWAAVLDPVARTLTYASAGHNPPRLVRHGTVMALDEASGLPLGIDESEKYSEVNVSLGSGDLLVVYTDGGVGQTGAEREASGETELAGIRDAWDDCSASADDAAGIVVERSASGERSAAERHAAEVAEPVAICCDCLK